MEEKESLIPQNFFTYKSFLSVSTSAGACWILTHFSFNLLTDIFTNIDYALYAKWASFFFGQLIVFAALYKQKFKKKLFISILNGILITVTANGYQSITSEVVSNQKQKEINEASMFLRINGAPWWPPKILTVQIDRLNSENQRLQRTIDSLNTISSNQSYTRSDSLVEPTSDSTMMIDLRHKINDLEDEIERCKERVTSLRQATPNTPATNPVMHSDNTIDSLESVLQLMSQRLESASKAPPLKNESVKSVRLYFDRLKVIQRDYERYLTRAAAKLRKLEAYRELFNLTGKFAANLQQLEASIDRLENN